jgi:hypothetical protein
MVMAADLLHGSLMLVICEQEAPRMPMRTPSARRASIRPARLACAVALMLMTAVGWLAAPTSASATTTNHVWKYLHFPAWPEHGNDMGCTTRTILTGPGTYRWRVFSAHWAHTNQTQSEQRVLRLRRARYEWRVCWTPNGPKWSVYSRLRDITYGGKAALTGDDIKGAFGDGRYHIGATLDNVR